MSRSSVRWSSQSLLLPSNTPPAAESIVQPNASRTTTSVAGRGVRSRRKPSTEEREGTPLTGEAPASAGRSPAPSKTVAGSQNHHSNQPTSQTNTGSIR